MFHSIRWRLVASYVLLALISVSTVGLLATVIIHRYIQEQEVQKLQANAESLAQQLQPLMWVNAASPQIHSLTQAASFLGDVRVRILDREGYIMADSGQPVGREELVLIYPHGESDHFSFQKRAWFNLVIPGFDESFPFSRFDRAVIENLPSGTTFQYVQRDSSPWGGTITFGMPVIDDTVPPRMLSPHAEKEPRSSIVIKEPIGSSKNPLGYVEMSAGQDFGSAALATTRRAFIFAGIGATLLAAIVGMVMSHRLTSPLRSLQETASRMGAGDLAARAQYKRRDEIGNLATQFNQMADQLQENFVQIEHERDTLQRFITDASHELRTPVTALKNFLTLIQGKAAHDPEARSEFLAESQIQVERLEWITNNLLDLSRLDAGLVELEIASHDLGDLIASAAEPYKPLAEDRSITITITPPEPPITLSCDAQRLQLVLSNLLDNALKFTPPGGVVTISAEETAQVTRILISDTGVGIPVEDQPNIFDRFYRGRHHAAQGSGLGLAISRSLLEMQGGKISVESKFGEGAKFIIEFPTA